MDRKNESGEFIDKKQFIIFMVFVTVAVVTLFLTVFLLLNNRITKLHETEKSEETPVFNNNVTNNTVEEYYTIKEFQGKIGVFKNNDFQYLIDIFVFTLPENDKKSLSQGITVSSEQELLDILSSYY